MCFKSPSSASRTRGDLPPSLTLRGGTSYQTSYSRPSTYREPIPSQPNVTEVPEEVATILSRRDVSFRSSNVLTLFSIPFSIRNLVTKIVQ